ncbi:hypothetical protein F5Y19DRAFT_464695 [Xylariaceae sp. FL1651]|nr:hypothetical protein F5Y19DRAFT_464695 [Xylariaceae sp. FL1651]
MPSKRCTDNTTFPYTTIAGVKVVDTPLVQKARALIEANFESYLVRHMYRSWLFGAAAYNNNATLAALIDPEVHAIATILHDLGWDQRENSPWRSTDKRFEIDGAIGATDFIRANAPKEEWDDNRIQLVWDAISLHGTPSISNYKQPVVKWPARNDTFTFLARTKPNSTYDTWIEPWGVAFVPGYNPVGHCLFDRVNPNVTAVPPAKRSFHAAHRV